MPNDTMPASAVFEAAAHETLVTTLRNTHALEKQQIKVLETQLDRFAEYPDLHARVTEHILESREHARRLEAGLEACGDSPSMIKDAMMSVMGLGQSSVQAFGDDAVLKAMTADIMEEHLEIATYRTLLSLADMAGKPELRPRLEETLREEEAMAAWFDDNIVAITRRFVEVKASEKREAEASPRDAAATPDGEEPKTIWQTLEDARSPDADPKPTTDTGPGTTPDKPSTALVSETPRASEAQAPVSSGVRNGN